MIKIVKGLKISLDKAPLRVITRVKGDMVKEVVQQPAFWASLRIKWIKPSCKIE